MYSLYLYKKYIIFMNLLQQIKFSVAKQLAQLSEVETSKGILYSENEYPNVNDTVYIWDENQGLFVLAPTGEYELPDTQSITIYKEKYIIVDGVLTERVSSSVYVDKATESNIQMSDEPTNTDQIEPTNSNEPDQTETNDPIKTDVEEPKGPSETDLMRESISKLEESLNKQNEIIEKLTTSYNNLLDERKSVEIKDKKVDNNGVHPALQIAFGKK